MLLAFILSAIALPGIIGIYGLLRGELDLTYERVLIGRNAKIVSVLCLLFSLAMVVITITAVLLLFG